MAQCHPDRPVNARGLCSSCYNAQRRGRAPKFVKRPPNQSLHDWLLQERSEPTDTGCRLWLRGKSPKGYGVFGTPTRSVTRTLWEMFNGPIPAGMLMCHTCDTPSCCEVTHLFLGTPAQNMTDCQAKGRRPKGAAHWHSRLSETDVRAIRARHAAGAYQCDLAADYGVNSATISNICTRTTWRHVV
jgi:hypothetical protein